MSRFLLLVLAAMMSSTMFSAPLKNSKSFEAYGYHPPILTEHDYLEAETIAGATENAIHYAIRKCTGTDVIIESEWKIESISDGGVGFVIKASALFSCEN